MTNTIYVYEGQLRELISNKNQDVVRGVAFEWKDEGVFHIHTTFPKVAPSGYPVISFFKIEKDLTGFENSKNNFDKIIESLPTSELSSHKPVIGIFLYLDNKKLHQTAYIQTQNGIEICEVNYIPEKSELYSRSKGLLEVDILENKNALIIGLGSFGSIIAVELAKAGVGSFTLVDFDRIELSNVSRHICGVNELGRFKTFAVRDSILVKNPFAQIKTHEIDINENRDILEQIIKDTDIVICATDNNRSRFNINEIAFKNNKTVLYGRAITRAEGGDIFKLNGQNPPCYCCLIGENNGMKYGGEEEITSIEQANSVLPSYTTPEQKDMAVQVGLSSDILPMCNLMVKLALVELSKGLNSGINSLENELTYNYYFWGNRREKNYLNYAPFNDSKGMPTILKWYGANIPKDSNCFLCSSNS
jgi:molybdopterin/thiamine biosynthesis adenylyltransferase